MPFALPAVSRKKVTADFTVGHPGGAEPRCFPMAFPPPTPGKAGKRKRETLAASPPRNAAQAIGQWPQLARSATVTGSLRKLVREQRVEHSPGGGCRLAGDGCRTGQAVVTGWHRQAALPKERYRSNPQALVVTVTGNARRRPDALRFRAAGSRNSWELAGTANGNHPVPVLVSFPTAIPTGTDSPAERSPRAVHAASGPAPIGP